MEILLFSRRNSLPKSMLSVDSSRVVGKVALLLADNTDTFHVFIELL